MSMSGSPLALVFTAETALVHEGRPLEGVPELLRALRSAGYPLGLVTRWPRERWDAAEARLDLGPFATAVTDLGDGSGALADGLARVAAALELPPARVVHICGSPGDLGAARAAGMRVGEALWPPTANAAPDGTALASDPAPDWRFARPADVTRAFAAWCG
jgi:phosphoglycolate phosphatase-like HAD superfamily hydrolase